jgi:hypothetical protein
MTDAELQRWWPDLGTVVAELRRAHRPDVADLLVDAVRAGASSSEILGGIGVVLRDHRVLRSQLGDSAASAWDAVMADVYRAFPGSRLAHWFARLTGRSTYVFRARE